MKLNFDVLIEKDADGHYVASVPALSGCHTQAKSLDELMRRVKEAISLYLETDKEAITKARANFVGLQVVEVNA